jgi:ADP-ribosylglycohydrolase
MDTIRSLTGTMAGMYYGFDALSSKWMAELVQTAGVEDLVERCVGSRGGRVDA